VVFGEALASLLSNSPDLTVVGTATDQGTAVDLVRSTRPDVALVDCWSGVDDGLSLIDSLRKERVALGVVVITGGYDAARVVAAIRAGATGFVAKGASQNQLVEAITTVARGEMWLPRGLMTDVIEHFVRGHDDARTRDPLHTLSPRERDVLRYMATGMARTEIADVLRVSPNTVRTHIQHVFEKLDVHSSLEAMAVAMRSGLVPDRKQPVGSGRERTDASSE